jgi:hypothetical protein
MTPPITRQVKNVIYNMPNFFLKRKADQENIEYNNYMNINKLVAEATEVSSRSVIKIVAEGNSN